ETMSRVPMGSSVSDPALGSPRDGSYLDHYEATSQFEGADRIAHQWAITREDTERFAKSSQDRAAQAWQEGRFDTQIVPVATAEGTFARDEGMRATTLAGLAGLR